MKECRFIIENFTDSEDYRSLISEIRALGKNCFVIDKNNHFDFNPSGFNEGDCVLVQGSIQMTRNIHSRLPANCFPVAYNTYNNYLCSNYYIVFEDFLFNDKYELVKLSKLKENKFDYYLKFGKEALIFIRPDSGDKPFSGQLLDLLDFDRFWGNAVACKTEDNDLVLVSTPKSVVGEWRFVCSRFGEIIAQSTYMFQGQKTLIPSAPLGATKLCKQILDEMLEFGYPDSVFCIDICQDIDSNFWLLELTSFSSAGLYATDKKKVVKRVSEIAEIDYRENKKIW